MGAAHLIMDGTALVPTGSISTYHYQGMERSLS